MRAARAGLLLLPPLLCASLVTRAAEVATVAVGVRVAAPSCPIAPLPIADFVDALRVELAGRVASGGCTLVTPVIAPCDPSTLRVEIIVTDEVSGRASMRTISLEDVAPEARPRALALAVTDFFLIDTATTE